MRRYWIEKDCFINSEQGQSVVLKGEDFKHICTVCRQGVRSKFEVLTEESIAYFVEIIKKDKKQALAQVLSTRVIEKLPQPYVELCVSLPKFNKFELILEKAVELGVHKVRPFFSDFSFVTNPSKLSEERLRRWHKIIKSATQQTGRGSLMTLEQPCTLAELLDELRQGTSTKGLFTYEGDCSQKIKPALLEMKNTEFSSIWAFVGSEGGFSNDEVSRFSDHGLEAVTLGDQVLRVETACVSVASILKYELVDN